MLRSLTGILVAAGAWLAAPAAAPAAAVRPYERAGTPPPGNQLDELVFRRLDQLGLQPANLCSDAVFVRRAYLDVIGTLPTASGSNFREPQVNFYRALQSKEPVAIAQAVALTFMGVRPATWSKERWAGLILNSKTYQLSSIPQARQPEAEANFACYPLRRLEAEVLIDALNQTCSSSPATRLKPSSRPQPNTPSPAV